MNDYYSFLDENSISTNHLIEENIVNRVPDWATSKNVSLDAYNVIEKLKKEKLSNIAYGEDKSDFKNKSSYHIAKAEVAREVDVNPQPLFHSLTTTYSKPLLTYFNAVNKDLLKKKTAKLTRAKNGLRNLTKDELVVGFREQKRQLTVRDEIIVDELYERFKSQLSLDIKAKLRIK
jgi:hypothetical protein